MIRSGGSSTVRGFTLLEVLVTLAVLAIAAVLGVPWVLRLVTRTQLEATAREVAVLAQRARLEAIKRRVQTVVEVDAATGLVIAWADVDGEEAGDPPDLVFNPVAGELHLTTDYRIGRIAAHGNVELGAPGGQPAVDGLTDAGGRRVAVFLPTGSVESVGGFRFTDPGGANHLEIRLAPAGTGRVALRKWDQDADAWRAQREGGTPWKWYQGP